MHPYDPHAQARFVEALQQIRQEGRKLHDAAIAVGFKVGSGIGTELADLRTMAAAAGGQPVNRTFHIWRLDRTPNTASVFGTVAEVQQHLDHLKTLPCYTLDLDANPRIVEDTDANGARTLLSDKLTGETLAVLTEDFEASRRLLVHAADDDAPTFGGAWERNAA
ncbi:hypothetical protein [Mycobacterium sp. SP-6446]|uniref:hypothetical protein n=1 Tax=Mycobacterium sp. SP-6446 TaxID=1834162 RepID=UPI00096EC27E|nr:hypothetical protein [Mycobacterium sp. SP-6446]OMC17184.1 hypothetical protein A5736_16800 [Mycobacterium sp. SP-6446]